MKAFCRFGRATASGTVPGNSAKCGFNDKFLTVSSSTLVPVPPRRLRTVPSPREAAPNLAGRSKAPVTV
jgi:hypothetical protein